MVFAAVSPSRTAGGSTLASAGAPSAGAAAPQPSPPNKIAAFQKEASALKELHTSEFITQAEYELELAKLKIKYGIGAPS